MNEQWHPARHHFALARLIARAMARTTAAQTGVDRVVYGRDRHQSAIENHLVAAWFTASMTCFIAAALPLVTPLALVAAFPLALIAIQIPVYISGLPLSNPRMNAFFLMLCGTAAAAYFALQPGWVRFVAWTFLGVIALNAIAALVLWVMPWRTLSYEE